MAPARTSGRGAATAALTVPAVVGAHLATGGGMPSPQLLGLVTAVAVAAGILVRGRSRAATTAAAGLALLGGQVVLGWSALSSSVSGSTASVAGCLPTLTHAASLGLGLEPTGDHCPGGSMPLGVVPASALGFGLAALLVLAFHAATALLAGAVLAGMLTVVRLVTWPVRQIIGAATVLVRVIRVVPPVSVPLPPTGIMVTSRWSRRGPPALVG